MILGDRELVSDPPAATAVAHCRRTSGAEAPGQCPRRTKSPVTFGVGGLRAQVGRYQVSGAGGRHTLQRGRARAPIGHALSAQRPRRNLDLKRHTSIGGFPRARPRHVRPYAQFETLRALHRVHLRGHFLDSMQELALGRAATAGQLLGGWAIGWVAGHRLDRVAAFVDVTGAGLQVAADGATPGDRVGTKVTDSTRRATDAPTPQSVRERLESLMNDLRTVTDELIEARSRMYSSPGFAEVVPPLIDSLTLFAAPDALLTVEVLATTIPCPTLALWIRENPTMLVPAGDAPSDTTPGAEFNAALWSQFECPAQLKSMMIRFLRDAEVELHEHRDTLSRQ